MNQDKEDGEKKDVPSLGRSSGHQTLITQRKMMFGEILKTGWLSKKRKKSGEWQELWWVLRPGVISYHKNEQVSSLAPILPLLIFMPAQPLIYDEHSPQRRPWG